MSACGAADHACSTRLLVEGVQESVVVEAGPCSAPPATGRVKVWVDLAMPAMAAVDINAIADRAETEKGFFVWVVNALASHPVLAWRAHALRDRSAPGRLLWRPRESKQLSMPPVHPGLPGPGPMPPGS